MKTLICSALLILGAAACDNYDPCDAKDCGDLCTICDPDDGSCFETAVTKACNLNGVCSAAQPAPTCI